MRLESLFSEDQGEGARLVDGRLHGDGLPADRLGTKSVHTSFYMLGARSTCLGSVSVLSLSMESLGKVERKPA